MTQIDFYVLAGTSQLEQMQFACRLLAKAQKKHNRVFIYTDSEVLAKQMDELIWTYLPQSFIPHSLEQDPSAPAHSPVQIGWQSEPRHHHDILINLSQQIPPFFGRFSRYLGVVVQDDAILAATRQHYKYLKDRGYQITTRDMRLLG